MASLKAAPEVINSSPKYLLCLQIPEGKICQSWGMISDIWCLGCKVIPNDCVHSSWNTEYNKGLEGLWPFTCALQE